MAHDNPRPITHNLPFNFVILSYTESSPKQDLGKSLRIVLDFGPIPETENIGSADLIAPF